MTWHDPARELHAFAAAFGLGHVEWDKHESRDALTYFDPSFATSRLPPKPAFDAITAALRNRYGPCITLQLLLGDLELFSLGGTCAWNGILKTSFVTLYLKIEKSCLLERWGFVDPNVTFRLFFFAKALERILDVSLIDLEKTLDTRRRNIVLIPDHQIELTGAFLAVLGGDAVGRWRDHAAPFDVLGATARYEQVRGLVKWVHIELEALTPMHLALEWKSPPSRDDPIAGALFAQWTICSLLYLAEQSRRDDRTETWLCTFAADKYVARVEMRGAAHVRDALKASTEGNPWEKARTIGGLVQWVYGTDRARDRLNVLQVVVGSELEAKDATTNGSEVLRQAGEIQVRVDRAWKAFTEQILDEFFGQLKQLEDTVESTTRAYDDQIQALTKTLIDNMLAAVAVIVASFIAAMFKTPFQPYAFWFGAGLYLAYLIVFPIKVGLSATHQRFKESSDFFARRRKIFEDRLTAERVHQIVGTTVVDREQWFERWFGKVRMLYFVVLAVVIVTMFAVPSIIRWSNDRFTVTEISYGVESRGLVPVTIRGENFDKDKEIVVRLSDAVFTNTDGKTLNVHGATVLTLTVPKQKLRGVVVVRQGRRSVTRALP